MDKVLVVLLIVVGLVCFANLLLLASLLGSINHSIEKMEQARQEMVGLHNDIVQGLALNVEVANNTNGAITLLDKNVALLNQHMEFVDKVVNLYGDRIKKGYNVYEP